MKARFGVLQFVLVVSLSGGFFARADVSSSSVQPTENLIQQVGRSRVFRGPLVWVGEHAPGDPETQALLAAIGGYKRGRDMVVLETYIQEHPRSPWNPCLRARLAEQYRVRGRLTPALLHWEAAWQATRFCTSGPGREVRDSVVGPWAKLLATLGRVDSLSALFEEAGGRFIGDAQSRLAFQRAWEAYGLMRAYPDAAYRCGTYALGHVGQAAYGTNRNLGGLLDRSAPPSGFSMTKLSELAQLYRLGLVPVQLPRIPELPVPSVVHWKQNHYAAIVGRQGDLYRVRDAIDEHPQWRSLEDITEEASGHFLVLASQASSDWPRMTRAQTDLIFGRGFPNWVRDERDEGCDAAPGGVGAFPTATLQSGGNRSACITCPPAGMPTWWVTEPYLNVWLTDEPLSYRTSHGENVSFRWIHRQRGPYPLPEGFPRDRFAVDQPPFLTNSIWSHNFLSHIKFRDPFFNPSGPWPPKYAIYQAIVCLPGGGTRFYEGHGTAFASTEGSSQVLLQALGTNVVWHPYRDPSQFTNDIAWPDDSTDGFRLVYPDGSQDIYNLTHLEDAEPPSSYAEAFLTKRIDPSGNALLLAYEHAYLTNDHGGIIDKYRVKYVIDYDGRTNTFRYLPDAWPNGLEQISEIENPYGAKARFEWDPYYRITNIIDSLNQTNRLTSQAGYWDPVYSQYVCSGWITQLTTPYGDTTFTTYEAATVQNSTNQGNMGGHNRISRSVEVGEPGGTRQLYLYRYHSPDLLPSSYPANECPNVPDATFDNGSATDGTPHAELTFRNSFYWGRKQYQALSTTNKDSFGAQDYRKGRWRHWLANTDDTFLSDSISLERAPSPDAAGSTEGPKTWFDYAGKPSPHRLGDEALPRTTARVLPDGTTQYAQITYDSNGHPHTRSETFTQADGTVAVRRFEYDYDANGVDLQYVKGPDQWGNLTNLATFSYNANHQVTSSLNADGERYVFTYDASTHQLLSVTNPTGLTTRFTYYPLYLPSNRQNAGFLSNVTELPTGATNSFTYSNGLVRTSIDTRRLTNVYTWDSLQRLTGVSFPDKTYLSNRYDKLDLIATKDRLGSWSYFGYDSAQHLTELTNALTNWTHFAYCDCGSLESITDPSNRVTSFAYDNQGRRTAAVWPDSSSVHYQYDLSGRLSAVTDGLGRGLTFAYNNQGLVTAVSNAFGPVAGAIYNVQDRPVRVTDAVGVTATNTFDIAGRLVLRQWPDGGSEAFYYTPSNGLTAYTNQSQQRTLFRWDSAGRLAAVTNANGEVTRYGYNPAGDLTALTNARNAATTWRYDVYGRVTNRFDALNREIFRYAWDAGDRLTNRWSAAKGNISYTYDPVGNQRSKTTQSGGAATTTFQYDAWGRLTSAAAPSGNYAFAYTPIGQLASESGPWGSDTVTYGYTEQQRTSLSVAQPSGPAWTVSYSYDAARRLQTVTSPAGDFGYDYQAGQSASPAPVIRKVTLPNQAWITNVFDPVGRLRSTALFNQWANPLDLSACDYDKLGNRTNATRGLGLTTNRVAYAYDKVGQLVRAFGYETNGALRLAENWWYVYDAAGNLQCRTNNTLVQTFVTDSLDQLSTVGRSGALTVAGVMPMPITNVSINNQAGQRYSDMTFASSSGFALTGNDTFTVIAQNAYGRGATNTLTVSLPATVTFTYDTNGNLLGDGLRSFEYDSDNELTAVQVASTWRTEFTYDPRFRRRVQLDRAWQGGQWVTTNETRCVYDGELPLQERAGNNQPAVTYTRGVDLSLSLDGAGGIGGLLARTDSSGSLFYHADGAGNVTALMNSRQEVVARYLYSPFGGTVAQWGSMAEANAMRFSSMPLHRASGLSLYLFRAYDPGLQRWLTRDLIGERGGINLYGFLGNSPLDHVDPLGLGLFEDFGDWELNALQKVKEFFTGKPGPMRLADPGVDRAGTGLATPYTDADGNDVTADLVFDVGTIPFQAALIGPEVEGLEVFRGVARCGKVAKAAKRIRAARTAPTPRLPGLTVDPVAGQPVGRFIGTESGPAMIEPIGGRTVAAGKGGVDTHTLYPNGANYQRLNPAGHANNPTPHAHGHAPGTGPGMRGQGPSLDTSGNVVPWNSPDAHWPFP
jgi:RHS repeat-associated protein